MIVFLVVALIIALSCVVFLGLERKRKNRLLSIYSGLGPEDKYYRTYRSIYGPEEFVTEVVYVVGKSRSDKGVLMIKYEYENDNTTYEAPLEDFLDCFKKME